MRSTVTVPTWIYTLGLILLHAYLGIGYLTTPPTFQLPTTLTYAVELATLSQWGLLFLLGTIFTVVGAAVQNRIGSLANLAAAAPFLVFAPAVLFAELDGTSGRQGPAALYMLPILVHAVMAWHAWSRDARA